MIMCIFASPFGARSFGGSGRGHLLFVLRAPSPIHYSDTERLTKCLVHGQKWNQVISGVMLWGWVWLEAPPIPCDLHAGLERELMVGV